MSADESPGAYQMEISDTIRKCLIVLSVVLRFDCSIHPNIFKEAFTERIIRKLNWRKIDLDITDEIPSVGNSLRAILCDRNKTHFKLFVNIEPDTHAVANSRNLSDSFNAYESAGWDDTQRPAA